MSPVPPQGEPTFEGPRGHQSNWYKARGLLRTARYEAVAEVLRQAQIESEQNGQRMLADISAAAHRICQACLQCRAETEWHQRAFQEADQREQALRQELDDILELVIRGRVSEPRAEPASLPTPRPATVSGQERKIPGLLKRLQNIFGLKRDDKSPDRDAIPSQPTAPVSEHTEPESAIAHDSPPFAERPGSSPGATSTPDLPADVSDDRPSLTVYCLGPFQLYQDDVPVEDWPSSKGKSIFKYLVTHRQRAVAKEVLMDLFWPDSDPDAARNSLNVAIYGLRQALRKGRPHFHHVLFEDDRYLLNRDLHIWVDVEEFRQQLSTAQKLQQQGNMEAAIRLYSACEALYRDEFLAEDRYEEWAIPHRRNLQEDYLGLLEHLSRYYLQQEKYSACVTVSEKMLAVEPCREDAHRQLMRAYSRQSQRYLALRQYHACREALERELGVKPGQRTVELYNKIRRQEPI